MCAAWQEWPGTFKHLCWLKLSKWNLINSFKGQFWSWLAQNWSFRDLLALNMTMIIPNYLSWICWKIIIWSWHWWDEPCGCGMDSSVENCYWVGGMDSWAVGWTRVLYMGLVLVLLLVGWYIQYCICGMNKSTIWGWTVLYMWDEQEYYIGLVAFRYSGQTVGRCLAVPFFRQFFS